MHELAPLFLAPSQPKHRHYEVLRAICVDELTPAEAARRFGYAPGTVRNLYASFRKNPDPAFFAPGTPSARSPDPADAPSDRDRRILDLRRGQQLSVLEIADRLTAEGRPVSKSLVANVLKRHRVPKLARRASGSANPVSTPIADRRQLDLSPRTVRTPFGGLFLFAPFLTRLQLADLLDQADFPGSASLPAACAMRSLLGLKLYGLPRKSHAQTEICDPGLALFAGLNAVPNRSTLAEYARRLGTRNREQLTPLWLAATHDQGLPRGADFDLDFHTIPHHGADRVLENPSVSKRSRRQRGVLAFVARDAAARAFTYVNATVRKEDQAAEILAFAAACQQRNGAHPSLLVFDSTLTTYAHLAELDGLGIGFLTLRRRTKRVLRQVDASADADWQSVCLTNAGRAFRRPRALDQRLDLPGYPQRVRQVAVDNIGAHGPILLLTNRMEEPVAALVDRYARRVSIENGIMDTIDFFQLDALSSGVPLPVDFDLQLTLIGDTLYRLLAERIGQDSESECPRTLFRKFVRASADVVVAGDSLTVRFGRRAHNRVLEGAGLADESVPLPWLGNLPLRFAFAKHPQ